MTLFTLAATGANVLLIPLLLAGLIRKLKARMQNRLGAPLTQPFYDLAKLLRKGETVSNTTSWIFVWAPRVGLAVALLLAVAVPWSGLPVPTAAAGLADLVLVAYLVGLARFFALLAAMDAGSAFGGLGASREATLTVLAEPIFLLALAALALGAKSTSLAAVAALPVSPFVAVLAGAALVVAALAELSRMPVDDPTTHLELTMVHEAMILENSGRNLALMEYAVALRTCLFLGLATQALLRAWPGYAALAAGPRYALGLAALIAAGAALAIAEGVLVKLYWRRVPNFLAFGLTLSLLAALIAAAHG